jgi:hypothetical protein
MDDGSVSWYLLLLLVGIATGILIAWLRRDA